MSFIKKVLFHLIILLPGLSFGQEDLLGFIQPQISLNYSLTPVYAHNFSVSQRVFFLNPPEAGLPTRHIDLSHFSNLKLAGQRSVGLGIMYRFREAFEDRDVNELRLTEQVNFTFQHHSLRFGHRLRAEQRILPLRTVHRFRYRFAADGPLQGEELNFRELYWIGHVEGLMSVGKGLAPIYGLRASAWVGYLANETFRLQIGTEFRQIGGSVLPGQSVLFLLSSLILNL